MRIALLGVGLIGGSIARALRARGGFPADGDATVETLEIVGWTPSGRGPRAAMAGGAIDAAAASLSEAIAGAAIILLAAPPLACLELLDLLDGARSRLLDGTVVTDVASTKAAICDRAVRLELPFVGGHPLAGVEASGFDAADAALFEDRPWVIVDARTSPVGGPERVAALARACGARPLSMDAREHDVTVAAISHLPLVIAAALVTAVVGEPGNERPDWPTARSLAAGGWASMTRLARGDAEMATGIVATNTGPVVDRLRSMAGEIERWIELLDRSEPDLDAIRARFAAARAQLRDAVGDDRS